MASDGFKIMALTRAVESGIAVLLGLMLLDLFGFLDLLNSCTVSLALARAFARPGGSLGVLRALLGHVGLFARRNGVEQELGRGGWVGCRRGSDGSPPQRGCQLGEGDDSSGMHNE